MKIISILALLCVSCSQSYYESKYEKVSLPGDNYMQIRCYKDNKLISYGNYNQSIIFHRVNPNELGIGMPEAKASGFDHCVIDFDLNKN